MSIHFSRKLTKKQLKEYTETLEVTPEQKDVLIGTLLGDASMSLRNDKVCYSIKFEQNLKHRHYVSHLFKIFEPLCGTGVRVRITGGPRNVRGNRIPKSVWFRTYRLNCLAFYYNYFYVLKSTTNKDGKTVRKSVKVIRKDIAKYLTPRALAYWFMDDGTYNVDKKFVKNYLFSTQGFEKHEVQRLCDALKKNFDIDAQVHKDKDKWRIYILRASSQKFLDLIKPYIHSNFTYKL